MGLGDKEKEFYINTVIYFIGIALSKVLMLAVLPIITNYVTTEEYGIYDLIVTIASLCLPLFTFQIIETAYRFIYDATEKEIKIIITNVAVSVVTTSSILMLITYAWGRLWLSSENLIFIMLYYIGTVLLTFYQRVARSLGNNREYAISGLVNTFVLLVFQLLFVICTSMRVDGLIYAYFISCIASTIYLEVKIHATNYVQLSLADANKIMGYLRFSIPLVPNSILWWATSAINRIITIVFMGAVANGIFSMSNKFASIVTMVSSVLVLSWQELCIREQQNPDRNNIFSDICKVFLKILVCTTACAILIQKLYFIKFVDESYLEAMKYIPIVMVGTLFSSLNSFWGAGYLAFKLTKDSFKTTVLGAIVNVLCCLVGTKFGGLYGVAFSSLLGYFVMWVVRIISLQPYFRFKIGYSRCLAYIGMLILSCVGYYCVNEMACLVLVVLIIVIFIISEIDNVKKILGRR